MRFASIGSGSEGNALLVESGTTRVMIDCGFGARDTAHRLARIGLVPDDLSAILVTHEHSDHAGGVEAFAARHDIPVYLTFGTLEMIPGRLEAVPRVMGFDAHDAFAVGDLSIHPFPVPHDARDPVQFVVGDGASRIGVLTDLGMVTPFVTASLSGCDALVIECNHDTTMLARGPYPPSLKTRIAGRYGHLCNDAAADLLRSIDRSRLRHVLAAHLSEQNNTPDLARRALAQALGCAEDWIGISEQGTGFDWRMV